MSRLQAHPFSRLFPMLDGEAFEALADDIAENGLRNPITLFEGQILDGRNRHRACEVKGIDARFDNFTGTSTEALSYVVSLNLKRRHLNESQRGMVAAKLANMQVGNVAKQRSLAAQASENKETNHGVPIGTPVVSRKEAQEMMNVSKGTLARARIVLNEGTPEDIEAIEKGEGAVSTIADRIRDVAPRAPSKSKPQKKETSDRRAAKQMRGQLWRTLRDALVNLSSLPKPPDMLPIVSEHDRGGLVDHRLSTSLQWLKDFSDAYTESDAVPEPQEDRHDRTDARNGHSIAGPEQAQPAAE